MYLRFFFYVLFLFLSLLELVSIKSHQLLTKQMLYLLLCLAANVVVKTFPQKNIAVKTQKSLAGCKKPSNKYNLCMHITAWPKKWPAAAPINRNNTSE